MNNRIESTSTHEWIEVSDPSKLAPTPVVSVLMITYNHEAYLAEAIEGVLAQKTDFQIELLIGEDCSTDQTRQIALEYQKRHPEVIRVFYPNKNKGMLRNLKTLFLASKGEFIALCEGDDYWCLRDKLQLQIDFLARRPNYGAVHTDYNKLIKLFGWWRTYKSFKFRSNLNIPTGDIFEQLLKWFFVTTCTVVIRRPLLESFYQSPLSNPDYAVGDVPLFSFVAKNSHFGYLPIPSAMYRTTPGSIMNSSAQSGLYRIKSALTMYDDFLSLYNVSTDTRQAIKRRLANDLVQMSVLAGNIEEFENGWQLLKRTSPFEAGTRRKFISLFLIFFRPALYARETYHKIRLALYITLKFQKLQPSK